MGNVSSSVRRIVEPVLDDMLAVDQAVVSDLQSDIGLIKRISDYIVTAGGKRMRPLVLLLMARALGYQGKDHVFLATIIEYVHTSSLLHDDVVDEADLRRGKPTASFKWGNSAAVLVGDFMYSRAFQLMVKTGNLRICEIVAKAVNMISEGEIIQLLNIHDTTVDESRYFKVIERKTGILFEAAARLAATVAGATKEQEERLAHYALALGTAFQIIDDVLDYDGSQEKTGKVIGTDLKEGKMTMPLIYALQNCSDEDGDIIREAISAGGGDIGRIVKIIRDSGAIEKCRELANKVVSDGIASVEFLPSSQYKNSLIELLTLTTSRDK